MNHTKKQANRQDLYRILLYFILFFDILCIGYAFYLSVKETIPDQICLSSGNRSTFSYDIPAEGTFSSERDQKKECGEALINMKYPFTLEAAEGQEEYLLTSKLFGILSLKETNIKVKKEEKVIPCGLPVGIYVQTEGLLVLDTQVLQGADGRNYEPAGNRIKAGDYILSVNGEKIETKEQLQKIIAFSEGKKMELEIRRNQKEHMVYVTPLLTKEGDYKLGIWIRDDTQGLGTITYIRDGEFGALGHGIRDYDTGTQMEIEGGSLYEARVLSVKKGKSGTPGELIGQVQYGKENYIGKINSNSEEGIYGTLECDLSKLTEQSPIPVAYKQDVQKGKASIRFALDGEVKDYEIRITKLDGADQNKKQGIEFEVTDEELLEKTGGVVQGMSGSPILQDGKIVGAVTHVLVNDPTRGYGIFIENMLEH